MKKDSRNLKFRRFSAALALGLSFLPLSAQASASNGTIDSFYNMGQGLDPQVGTIYFGTAQGNIHVADGGLSGYAWSPKFGWINLAPTFGGVTNDGEGTLGGYAWGDQAGWVNFAPAMGGVTIDSSGVFKGFAWSQNLGWISLNCASVSAAECSSNFYKVSTDWRPISIRGGGTPPPGGGGSNGSGSGNSPSAGASPTPGVTTVPTSPAPSSNPPATQPSAPPPSVTPSAQASAPASAPSDGSAAGSGAPSGSGSGSGAAAGSSISIITNLFQPITDSVTQTYGATLLVTRAAAVQVARAFKNPTVSAVSKVTTTIGVASVAAQAVATSLFVNPLSFSEIFLIPLRLWAALLAALGLKKRRKPWGTVYDSVTKQPLDPAYVVLLDEQGNEVNTSITDLDGRYGFLLAPGRYKLVANKTNYAFPSTKLAGRAGDELYADLYFGEDIVANEAGQVLTRNIPMDQQNFDWNEFAKNKQKVTIFFSKRDLWIRRISNVLFVGGLALAVVAFFAAPAPYNFMILMLYAFILVMRRLGIGPKSYGAVTEAATGLPLSYAIIRVHSVALGAEMIHRTADKLGRYYCLIPPGQYFLTIEKKNDDESYTQVFQSPVMDVKNGVLNQSYKV